MLLFSRLFPLLLLGTLPVTSYTYNSYQTKIECNSKLPIQHPKSVAELQAIIKTAIDTKMHVKVIGNLGSLTDTICTDGVPIQLSSFDSVTVDPSTSTAVLGTGQFMLDALNKLHNLNYTINKMPSFGGITIGGAIGLGAHGSSLTHPTSLSEYLVAVTFIDGKGNLRKIKLGDPHFDAFRVNFGFLGVIVDVTIKVEPKFKMQVHNIRVSDELLVKTPTKLIEMGKQSDFFQFWWFPTSQGLVLSQGKDFLSTNTTTIRGDAQTNIISNVTPFIGTPTKIAFELVQTTNNVKALKLIQDFSEKSLYQINIGSLLKTPVFTEGNTNKFVNPAVGFNYKLMTNRCSPCPWEAEFFNEVNVNNLTESNDSLNEIPTADGLKDLLLLPDEFAVALDLNKFNDVIADMNKLFTQYPTHFPLFGILFRFSPKSKGLLALSADHDTFHIDLAYPMRYDQFSQAPYGLEIIQTLIQLLITKYDGRPHWGKSGLHFYSSSILQKVYNTESLSNFKLAVDTYDPNRLFSNNFGNRILNVDPQKFDINSKVRYCALQDYCICSKDSDCSTNRKCQKIWDFNVCK